MIVLRIEDERGRGPVNHGRFDEAGIEARDLFFTHCSLPSPWERMAEPCLSAHWIGLGDARRKNWLFGFRDRRQLRRYMKPELTKALRLLGFRVVFYDVPEERVVVGYSQVVYHKLYARRLDENHQPEGAKPEEGRPHSVTTLYPDGEGA